MRGNLPCPGADTFPELYSEREELLEAVQRVITRTLPTEETPHGEIIQFSDFEPNGDTVLAALTEAPDAALNMFLAVCGVGADHLEQIASCSDIFSIAKKRSGLPHTDHRAKRIAQPLTEELCTDLFVETVLQQTAHWWTRNHRRHKRKQFEDRVLTYLESHELPVVRSQRVTGAPDIAIANSDDAMDVVGEIRISNRQDLDQRIKEFESEIRELSEHHPDAAIAIVTTSPEDVPESRFDQFRQQLTTVNERTIRFYTDDELDRLVSDCREWSSQLQLKITGDGYGV